MNQPDQPRLVDLTPDERGRVSSSSCPIHLRHRLPASSRDRYRSRWIDRSGSTTLAEFTTARPGLFPWRWLGAGRSRWSRFDGSSDQSRGRLHRRLGGLPVGRPRIDFRSRWRIARRGEMTVGHMAEIGGVPGAAVAISGDSAGGNLAAAIAIALREDRSSRSRSV